MKPAVLSPSEKLPLKSYGNVQPLYVILFIGDSALPASLTLCKDLREEPVTYGPHSSF